MLVDPRVVDLSTLESHILSSTAVSISRGISKSSRANSAERLGAPFGSALSNSTVEATTGLINSRKAVKSSAVLADSNLRNVVSDTNISNCNMPNFERIFLLFEKILLPPFLLLC